MNLTKQLTRSNERMHTNIDWLNSRHSFSFGGHYDPNRMGFGPLRVVNDDQVAPDGGFPPHPHKDMEIVSIVLDGQLEHKDSMGNGRVIQTGDIQYMSAGTGVVHSEFNPSKSEPAHFLQIWIEPEKKGLAPRYEDKPIIGEGANEWKLILSSDGRDDSIEIRNDVELRTVQLDPDKEIEYSSSKSDRGLWLFIIEGKVESDGEQLGKGDFLAITGSNSLSLKSIDAGLAKVLLFDLPIE